MPEARPGWYRNTGPTQLVIQPPTGPTHELLPAGRFRTDPFGQPVEPPEADEPGQTAWLPDDLHHPHLAFAGDDPAGPDTGSEG